MGDVGSLFGYRDVVIGSATPVKDVIEALAARGCSDLTPVIDPATCTTFPLAGGGLCDVYRGTTNHGISIAIKSLRIYDAPGKENDKEKTLKHAARELYHWSKLRHPNVLPLMGLAIFRGRMSMVSEWMENGTLPSYISLNPHVSRVSLCMDVCAGLSYIHGKGMVHGDLKGANVMICQNGVAMIADFGNARLRDLTLAFTNTTNPNVTVRWAAPELLDESSASALSEKADVYAYGMTVLEALTGNVPYHGFSERQVMIMVAFKHKTPDRPTIGVSTEIWEILSSCWLWEPSERPDIASIEKRLLATYMDGNKPRRAGSLNPDKDTEANDSNYLMTPENPHTPTYAPHVDTIIHKPYYMYKGYTYPEVKEFDNQGPAPDSPALGRSRDHSHLPEGLVDSDSDDGASYFILEPPFPRRCLPPRLRDDIVGRYWNAEGDSTDKMGILFPAPFGVKLSGEAFYYPSVQSGRFMNRRGEYWIDERPRNHR